MATLVYAPSFTGSYSGPLMLSVLQEKMRDHPLEKFYLLVCNRSVNRCYFNFSAAPATCANCLMSLQNCVQELDGKAEIIALDFLIEKGKQHPNSLPASVKKELDEAVKSTFISQTRVKDAEAYTNSGYRQYTLRQCEALFAGLTLFFKEAGITEVINFNGRYDYLRTVMVAAQQAHIRLVNMERCRPGGFLEIYPETLPHNMHERWKNIENSWKNSRETEAQKLAIGQSFFENKKSGKSITDRSYTGMQQKGWMPAYPADKKLIAIFNSSDDEVSALGDLYRNPYFEDQVEGIRFLFSLLNELSEYVMILRIHPNLKNVNEPFVTDLYALAGQHERFFVVRPEEKVDSYALLDKADKIITFGSSIGVEAAYWNKPSILLSKAVFYTPAMFYEPGNKAGILPLLQATLGPKGRDESIKMGYHYLAGGVATPFYEQKTAFGRSLFKGKYINRRNSFQKLMIALMHKFPAMGGLANQFRLKTARPQNT